MLDKYLDYTRRKPKGTIALVGDMGHWVTFGIDAHKAAGLCNKRGELVPVGRYKCLDLDCRDISLIKKRGGKVWFR